LQNRPWVSETSAKNIFKNAPKGAISLACYYFYSVAFSKSLGKPLNCIRG